MADQHLEEELHFFETQKSELLKNHDGQFVLIKGKTVAGTFTTFEEAFKAGMDKFGNVPFFIKQVLAEEPVQQIPALTLGMIRAAI